MDVFSNFIKKIALNHLSLSFTAVEIGLVRSSYTVEEDVGQFAVCAHITNPRIGCPVAYQFSVLAITVTGSASKFHTLFTLPI